MRCVACNKILTSRESTRRFKESGAFVDLCNGCLSTIDDSVQTVDSKNLPDEGDEDKYED